MSQRLPVIHAGLNKTGTTSLQRLLFARHPEVAFLGKYPLGKRNPAEGRYLTHGMGEFLDDVIGFEPGVEWERLQQTGVAYTPDCPEMWRRQFAAHIQPFLDEERVPVWSLERLCLGSPRVREVRALRIAQAFGPCKVVMVLREPLALVESLYFQRLKAAQLRDPATSQTGRYLSISDWLEDCWEGEQRDVLGIVDYGRTIQWFVDLFGRDNVGVFLFEDLVGQPETFLSELCAFCGIDSEQAYALMQNTRKNVRWTEESIARLRWIDRIPAAPYLFRKAPKARRARWLGVDRKHALSGSRARAEIPAEWAARISDACRSSNHFLRDEWGLALDRHGYPL